jgi:hypothetical protein
MRSKFIVLLFALSFPAHAQEGHLGYGHDKWHPANFIRQVAPGSWAEYADELRSGGDKLKQAIMAKVKHEFRGQLDPALDKIIKRKVEDFEFGIVKGREMNATTHNTVNIINSNISNAVVQITQSGKDAISKETAQKLQEIINSEEIKAFARGDPVECSRSGRRRC